jgi:hypothetical protein
VCAFGCGEGFVVEKWIVGWWIVDDRVNLGDLTFVFEREKGIPCPFTYSGTS